MDCLLRISKMIYKKHYHEASLKFPETLNKLRTSEAWFPPKNRNGEPQKKIARSYVKRKVYQLSNVWAWNRKKIEASKTGILKNKKECLSLKRGGSYTAEYRNWPTFSTGFGNIDNIFADFRKQEYCRSLEFSILKDGIRQWYISLNSVYVQ